MIDRTLTLRTGDTAVPSTSHRVEGKGIGTEEARLDVVSRLEFEAAAPSPSFALLVALACERFAAPMASISIIDADRQLIVASAGLGLASTERHHAFCDRVVRSRRPLLVTDALVDTRFAANPYVLGPPNVRSYVGAPLFVAGQAVGSMCVLSTEVDAFDSDTVEGIASLAEVVEELFELRYQRYRDVAVDVAAPLRPPLEGSADELRLALSGAVERDELSLVFQPVTHRHGERVSFEALLRWIHPPLGAVPPSVFIPLAEEAGLMGPIGDWVIRRGIEAARELCGHPNFATLAINVSGRQLGQRFASDLARYLRTSDLEPSCLELELTESVFVDLATAAETVASVRSLGVALWIDDFGVGHSSLDRLHRISVDGLKIDRSFVAELPGSTTILESIVSLAHRLGISVTAEGVETSDQHSLLRDIGCDRFQGYLFARPLTLEAAHLLLGGMHPDERQKPTDDLSPPGTPVRSR